MSQSFSFTDLLIIELHHRTECKQLGSKVWLLQIHSVVTDPALVIYTI